MAMAALIFKPRSLQAHVCFWPKAGHWRTEAAISAITLRGPQHDLGKSSLRRRNPIAGRCKCTLCRQSTRSPTFATMAAIPANNSAGLFFRPILSTNSDVSHEQRPGEILCTLVARNIGGQFPLAQDAGISKYL